MSVREQVAGEDNYKASTALSNNPIPIHQSSSVGLLAGGTNLAKCWAIQMLRSSLVARRQRHRD